MSYSCPITRIACACVTGPLYDTQYDLSKGCAKCGTGSRQISPLRVVASALPKAREVAETWRGEVLWKDSLVRAIRAKFDLGPEFFTPVEKKRSHERLPWWHVNPPFVQPRFDSRSKALVVEAHMQCPQCKRDGHFEDWERPHRLCCAGESERSHWPAILRTWEHYGRSVLVPRTEHDEQGYAQPRIVLRDDVAKWLKARVKKAVDIEPIEYIEPGAAL